MHVRQRETRFETKVRSVEDTAGCGDHSATATHAPAWTAAWRDRPPATLFTPHAEAQAKFTASQPGDRDEQEADQVAERALRKPSMATATDQTLGDGENKHAAATVPAGAHRGGQPLDTQVRAFFEPRLGVDLSHVRVHTDARAGATAREVNAIAYTVGHDIVFAQGQYQPETSSGQRLIAHELAHVAQQSYLNGTPTAPGGVSAPTGPAQPQENARAAAVQTSDVGWHRSSMTGAGRPMLRVMRQVPPAAAQTPAQEAIGFLQSMANFIATLRVTVLADLQNTPPIPIHTSYAAQFRAHERLNQGRIQRFLQSARSTYEAQTAALPANDPLRVQLREAFIQTLREIRTAADAALTISNGLVSERRQTERVAFAENMALWIEASPMTSAGLAETTAFQQADVAAGAQYESALESYLDDLLQTLPGLNLDEAQRNQIYSRLQIALRRAFVTVGAGVTGTLDVRAISNPQIAAKYRQVVSYLQGQITNARPINLITDALNYPLPDPIPDVTADLAAARPRIGAVDTSHVPRDEVAAVRYGILQAANAVFPPASTVTLQDAYWPLTMPVRRGGAVVRVRYELVFDHDSNVRAERIGLAQPREVAPAFSQLTVPQKKAQLVQDLHLAAIDDRPAHPPTGRAAALWTGPELDQVKAAFDLLPPQTRGALNGVTLVRDHVSPAMGGGLIAGGWTHVSPDPQRDQPGPPPHGPPHIHYYDAAFSRNDLTSVGAPGASGPGGDFTLAHEVGHMQMGQATAAANRQMTQASAALTAALATTPMNPAALAAWNAYNTAQSAANAAIVAYVQGVDAGAAQLPQLLQAAQAAVQARNQAHAALQPANVPAILVQRAAALNAANDALLATADQALIFSSLATRFGFTKFTDYARRSPAEKEWFAETFALYVTDPTRLLQMNRRVFLWFEAGMPMDRNWNPP